MIHFGRDGAEFVITDTDTMQSLRLSPGGAKDVCRFLMRELNVKSAIAEIAPGIFQDLFETDTLLKEGKTHGEKKL